MAANLVCHACGIESDAGPDEPWRCSCGHALDFAERPVPEGPAPDPAELDREKGLWAFEDLMPVERRVTLGEGFTAMTDAPEWDATFKLDYLLPSGSFKDRGATTTLSRAVELGVERVVEDSSGNAGAAIAQYAGRAGIDAEIYVPASAKASKLQAIEAAGATPVRVAGTRAEVTEACVRKVKEGTAWYASHAWNPAFFAGTMTFAFEVAAQRGWKAPDAVVSPLGHGTLFLGTYRGFSILHDAGWIDEMPRLLGVQATGYAPIADDLHGGTAGTNTGSAEPHPAHVRSARVNDLADGIQIDAPARGDQIRDAIGATDGDAIAVGEAAVESALERLHRGGFYVEPTSAAAPAGLEAYRELGVLDGDEDVVVPLTGSGLKG